MTPEEVQALIDQLKAAEQTIAAKLSQLESLKARPNVTPQQATDLKAAVAALVNLGKP